MFIFALPFCWKYIMIWFQVKLFYSNKKKACSVSASVLLVKKITEKNVIQKFKAFYNRKKNLSPCMGNQALLGKYVKYMQCARLTGSQGAQVLWYEKLCLQGEQCHCIVTRWKSITKKVMKCSRWQGAKLANGRFLGSGWDVWSFKVSNLRVELKQSKKS